MISKMVVLVVLFLIGIGAMSNSFAGIKKSKTKVFKKACFHSLKECRRAKKNFGVLTEKVKDITIGTSRKCLPGVSERGRKSFCYTPNITIRYVISPDQGLKLKVSVVECKYIKQTTLQANNLLRGVRCHIYCNHKSTGEEIFFNENLPRGSDAILTGECDLAPLSN